MMSYILKLITSVVLLKFSISSHWILGMDGSATYKPQVSMRIEVNPKSNLCQSFTLETNAVYVQWFHQKVRAPLCSTQYANPMALG